MDRRALRPIKTALACAPAACVIALAWMRLERPATAVPSALALASLALVPALVRPAWLRAPALVAAVLIALNIAFSGTSLSSATLASSPWLPGGLPSGTAQGFLSFYDVNLPFDPRVHPLMQAMVLLAVFAFVLALGLLVSAEKPVAAGLVLLAGAGWPATLEPGRGDIVRGVVILLALLVLLAAAGRFRVSRLPHVLVAGAAACVIAVAAAASPAVARSGLLDWQHWDPYTRGDRSVSVAYVWRSSYDGIRFPNVSTTVFEVRGTRQPLYWRATTLSVFDGTGWLEAPQRAPAVERGGVEIVRERPAVPRRARLVHEEITVKALRDTHLVGGSMPVAYRPPASAAVRYAADGTAFSSFPLARGERYSVWSYAAAPTPRQLARSPARYPAELRSRFLAVARRVVAPPFGAPKRAAAVQALFRGHAHDRAVAPYVPLYRAALHVAGGAKSPYAAVVALEAWFRIGGSFRYDEQPPQATGVPPLVGFVVTTHRGYCQHFAGAMTLMLRYLGVPARVAAGFTSGSFDNGVWVVSDRNAHTWVEAWFAGYGWLPFDPTPSRGALNGSYSAASPGFDAGRVLTAGFAGAGSGPLGARRLPATVPAKQAGATRTGGRAATWLALVVAGAAAATGLLLSALAFAKWARRRRRLAARDARALARACRQDVIGLLADQGVEVPASATASELAAIFETSFGVPSKKLAAALDGARFGPEARAAESALLLRRELNALRRRLSERLRASRRLRGFLSLRSLRAAA